jgi:hypothetical protein
MSRHRSLRFTLLDQQVVDAEDRPVGRVDDVELELGKAGAPRLVALLVGQQALGERLGGTLGRTTAAIAGRLRDPANGPGPARVPLEAVAETGPLVRLNRALRDLAGIAGLERWLAHHVVQWVPGAGDARE